KINRGDGRGGAEKGSQGSEQRSEEGRKRKMRLGDEGQDRPQGSSAGNTKHIRISKRVAKQGLKAGSSNGERGAHDYAKKNAGQTDIHDDQAVIAGDLAALPEKDAQQVAPEGVERNRNGAEFQSNDHDHK